MATIHVDGKNTKSTGRTTCWKLVCLLASIFRTFAGIRRWAASVLCRQCAVKQYQNAEDTRGRLVMSCMTPATEGTFISIDDEEANSSAKAL